VGANSFRHRRALSQHGHRLRGRKGNTCVALVIAAGRPCRLECGCHALGCRVRLGW
jgi:hypothetical protein